MGVRPFRPLWKLSNSSFETEITRFSKHYFHLDFGMISQQISAVSEPILAFQIFFINFRGQKIHLLNYYQCLS